MDIDVINQYLSQNKKLTLIEKNSKLPLIKNWMDAEITNEMLVNHPGNIGWVLEKGDMVIDVAIENYGLNSIQALEQKIGVKLPLTVKTPDGYHIYLKYNKNINKNFHKELPEYPGLTFFSRGYQVLLPSSKIFDKMYWWVCDLTGEFSQQTIPPILLSSLTNYKEKSEKKSDTLDNLEFLFKVNWNESKVKLMLSYLKNVNKDSWSKIGEALYTWNKLKGLEIWENWSKTLNIYIIGETSKIWETFKNKKNKATFSELSYLWASVKYDQEEIKLQSFVDDIRFGDKKYIEMSIVPKIRETKFSPTNLEKLIKAIRDRIKTLTGVAPPIETLRRELMVKAIKKINLEAPDWTKKWVFVINTSVFFNIETNQVYRRDSFNFENGENVPRTGLGKTSASKFVSDNGFLKTVDSLAYLPSYNEKIVEKDNKVFLNTYDSSKLTPVAKTITDDGYKAIEILQKHIKFMFSTDENAKIFEQWLAHQIQYPGVKILFAPLIQSIQGVGKSFFGDLLRGLLGVDNVGVVSPTQVQEKYNGWATEKIVNILEEIQLIGSNRYFLENQLKPLITDERVQINEKFVASYNTYNTTNYLCFTNYKDALPLNLTDRRYWVVFSPVNNLDELPYFVGETKETYYPKLFGIFKHIQEIKKWFVDYKITDEFKKLKQAPMTDEKMKMIAAEESKILGYHELADLIDKGGKFYSKNAVASYYLFKDFKESYSSYINISNVQKNELLRKMNFVPIQNPMDLGGRRMRVWTRTICTVKALRKMFYEAENKRLSGNN